MSRRHIYIYPPAPCGPPGWDFCLIRGRSLKVKLQLVPCLHVFMSRVVLQQVVLFACRPPERHVYHLRTMLPQLEQSPPGAACLPPPDHVVSALTGPPGQPDHQLATKQPLYSRPAVIQPANLWPRPSKVTIQVPPDTLRRMNKKQKTTVFNTSDRIIYFKQKSPKSLPSRPKAPKVEPRGP